MFCNKCGNKINDGILFCPKCGNQLATAQAPANAQAVTQPKPVAPQQKVTPAPKATTQPKPVAPQQNTTPAPKVEPKPQPAKQPKPVKQPKEEKAAPVKKKKKGGKIVLIILALLLVFGLVMVAAIPVAVCGIINYSETHADDVTYIEDFPVLKNQTELYVYDEVKFPVESYDIVIEKFIIGGAIKDICAKSEIIVDTSSNPSYELFLADGDYRITLIPNSSYSELIDDYVSEYEDMYDDYITGYEDVIDDYAAGYEDVVDDYYTIGESAASVIIIDVKVDGEDENAINAVNLNGQEVSEPVDEPVEEEPDDADKFIDATDADWEEFNTLLPTMYSYDFNCADITTAYVVESMIAELGGVTPLYMYHFEEYPTENYYEITEKYNGTEPDPKGIFTEYHEYSDTTYYNYYKIPKNNVKWLCEEVLNIEFDENYVSEDSYVYGDYVYRNTSGVGDAGWDEYNTISTTIVDGKYQIVIEHYFCYDEGDDVVREHLSTKQITAKIKVKDDGEKFWSYYEIKEYNSEF